MRLQIESQLGVYAGGYVWSAPERGGEESLDPAKDSSNRLEESTALYDPFADAPLLFWELSQVDPSADAIRDFANRRGRLVGTHYRYSVGANTLAAWLTEITAMRFAVEVAAAVAREDTESLGRIVIWKDGATNPDYAIPPEIEPALRRSWTGRSRTMVWTLFKPGDILGPAAHLVNVVVEGKTQAPKAQFFFGAADEPEIIIRVDELRQVVWFQFALAVRGRGLRFCAHCGKPFVMNVRSDQTLCSKNCTVLDTYHRKKKAQRMRADGVSVREIAKAVGAKTRSLKENMAQVKKWIGKGG